MNFILDNYIVNMGHFIIGVFVARGEHFKPAQGVLF